MPDGFLEFIYFFLKKKTFYIVLYNMNTQNKNKYEAGRVGKMSEKCETLIKVLEVKEMGDGCDL